MKIFSRSITEWASDADPSSKANKASDDNSVVTIEAAKTKKPGKAKQASAKTAAAETKNLGNAKQASAETAAAKMLATIANDCDDVLAFLQAVAVKSPRALAAPLSLCVDKRERVWFQRWTDVNLTKPPTPSPQEHLGLTDVLTDVATRLHSVVAFALAGDLSSPSVISFIIEIAFATGGKKIRLPIAEVLLRAAAGNLA